MPKPRPTPLTKVLPYSRVEEHRVAEALGVNRVMPWVCFYYEKCLVMAARRDWTSFTCRRCPLRPSPQEGGAAGAVLDDADEPDLRPIPELEEPVQVIDSIAALARVVARVTQPRRELNIIIQEDQLCLECFGTMRFGEEAWYCPNCGQVICSSCTPHHDACQADSLD